MACSIAVARKSNVQSRKRTKLSNSSSGHHCKFLSPNVEEAPQKGKRAKKEGQEETKSNSASEKQKLGPDWPIFSQDELRAMFGPRPEKMNFEFEDSDDSGEEDGIFVKEHKETNAMPVESQMSMRKCVKQAK